MSDNLGIQQILKPLWHSIEDLCALDAHDLFRLTKEIEKAVQELREAGEPVLATQLGAFIGDVDADQFPIVKLKRWLGSHTVAMSKDAVTPTLGEDDVVVLEHPAHMQPQPRQWLAKDGVKGHPQWCQTLRMGLFLG